LTFDKITDKNKLAPFYGPRYSVSTKKRPPKYNGVVFEILGRHHWNFDNRI